VGAREITITNGSCTSEDQPIIPFIEGDGTGREIWRASVRVFDAAVQRPRRPAQIIGWRSLSRREANKATTPGFRMNRRGVRDYLCLKVRSPLAVGGGIRSPWALRQLLDLYVCLRPVSWFKGSRRGQAFGKSTWPSSARTPKHIYAHRFEAGTADCQGIPGTVQEKLSEDNREDSFSATVRPRSKPASERERTAVRSPGVAIANKRKERHDRAQGATS